MQGIARRGALLALTVVAVLAPAAAAAATTTIAVSGSTLTITGDDGPNAILETSPDPTAPWFTAPGGQPIGAGRGCTQVTDSDVACTLPPGGSASVSLGAGDDTLIWWPTSIPVSADGGPGDDEITGDGGDDTLHGGPGNDTITGYGGDDTIYGDDGDDDLAGSSGNDTIDGGPGLDTINGDGQGDSDWIAAGLRYGNDLLVARDGELDRLSCEGGRDVAVVDRGLDNVAADCETVADETPGGTRAGANTSRSGAGAGAGNRDAAARLRAGAQPRFTIALHRDRLPSARGLAAGRPVTITARAGRSCMATATMRSATGSRLAVRSGRLRAHRAMTLRLTAAHAQRAALRTRRPPLEVRIAVSCTAGSRRATARMTLTLSR